MEKYGIFPCSKNFCISIFCIISYSANFIKKQKYQIFPTYFVQYVNPFQLVYSFSSVFCVRNTKIALFIALTA